MPRRYTPVYGRDKTLAVAYKDDQIQSLSGVPSDNRLKFNFLSRSLNDNSQAYGNTMIELNSKLYTMYGQGYGNLIESINWGQSWTTKHSSLLSTYPTGGTCGIARNESGTVVIAAPALNELYLKYSTDNCETFSSLITLTATGVVRTGGVYLYYDGGRFFVNSAATLYSSIDGVNWTLCAYDYMATNSRLCGVAYINSKYIAVDVLGFFYESTDGTTFTRQVKGQVSTLQGICYGDGKFVAPSNSAGVVIVSSNGRDWDTVQTSVGRFFHEITYGGGRYVAVSRTGTSTGNIMTSPDAITWTQQTHPNYNLYDIAYGNGRYVATTTTTQVVTSTNGTSWANSAASLGNAAICYGDKFVAVSSNGLLGCVMTSDNGTSWTPRDGVAGKTFRSVCYGNGKYVAVSSGSGDGGHAMTSTDGITWTEQALPANAWYGITYGDGKFIAISYNGSIGYRSAYSTDGVTWTLGNLTSQTTQYKAAYGNGMFAAPITTQLSGCQVHSSEDGINWFGRQTLFSVTIATGTSKSQLIRIGSTLYAISSGDDDWCGSRVLSTTNGTDWLEMTTDELYKKMSITSDIFNMAYSNGNYYLCGIYTSATLNPYTYSLAVYKSENLTNWDRYENSTVGGSCRLYVFGDYLYTMVGTGFMQRLKNDLSVDTDFDNQALFGSKSMGATGIVYPTSPINKLLKYTKSPNGIFKYNPSTSTYSVFGDGVTGVVTSVYEDSATGIIYVGTGTTWGTANYYDGFAGYKAEAYGNILSWNPSTEVWTVLSTDVDGSVYKIQKGPDGKIYACGSSATTIGGVSRLARYDTSTQTWESFGTAPNNAVYDFNWDSNGILYVCGVFTTIGGVTSNYVAKYNGTNWVSCGLTFSSAGYVNSVVPDTSGNMYLVGQFTTVSGNSWPYVVLYNGTSASSTGYAGALVRNGIYASETNALYVSSNNTSLQKYSGGSWSTIAYPSGFVPNVSRTFGNHFKSYGSGSSKRIYIPGKVNNIGTLYELNPNTEAFTSICQAGYDLLDAQRTSANDYVVGGSANNFCGIPFYIKAYVRNANTNINFATNIFGQGSESNNRIKFYVDKYTGSRLSYKQSQEGVDMVSLASGSLTWTAGVYYTVEAVYDGTNLTLYRNNEQVAQLAIANLPLPSSTSISSIGTFPGASADDTFSIESFEYNEGPRPDYTSYRRCVC